MKSLKKLYDNLRIQRKLTVTYLIIATIPMVALCIFFSTSLYDMIVSNTIRKEQNASMETAPLIEDAVDSVLSVSGEIRQLDFFRSVTGSGRTLNFGELADSADAASFNAQIQKIIADTFVTDVKVYLDLPESNALFSTEPISSVMRPIKNAFGTYWYGIFAGTPSTTELFCPSFYLSSVEIKQNGDMAYITKGTMFYAGKAVPYYTAVYFSQEHFDELLKSNLRNATNVAYIINSRDSIMATSNYKLSGAYLFDYDTVQDAFMSSNNFIAKKILGEDVYAGFYSIRHTDWYMVVALPSAPLYHQSFLIVLGFIGIYLCCILVSLAISTTLSRSMTRRLFSVIRRMDQCRVAPPIALPSSDASDELGELIDSYNYMSRTINTLMEQQAVAAEDLRVAEFHSLQAQINPHFLYNTMDMINWLSQQGRTQEVTTAVQKLSRFYKLTLSRKQSLTTIGDEVEHATIYVELQNMRFHDRIDFIMDIPDVLMDYSIPKLTLQPIVENCILHGIMETEDKQGTIVLTGWQNEDEIVLLISDDGIGIEPEKLEYILSEKAPKSGASGHHIAVYNTHRRLQLLYGTDYGLVYRSAPGSGTEVEIHFPLQLPGESVKSTSPETAAPKEPSFATALSLLSHPENKIYDIAKACGFRDIYDFNLQFQEHYGCTPEEYRSKMY